VTPVSARAAGVSHLSARSAGQAVIDACTGPAVRAPKDLVLFCGDGNDEVSGLNWKGWGDSSTHASGTVAVNLCQPNCAAGHSHSYGVSVSVKGLTGHGRSARYTRLTLSFSGTPPKGQRRVQQFNLTSRGPVLA
jgi:hypothetical protein